MSDPHDEHAAQTNAKGDPKDDTKIDLSPVGEGSSGGDAPATPGSNRPKGPIDDVAMYDVIEPPKSEATPTPSAEGKPRIEAPGLIDDFDEDADFSEESVLNEARRKEAAAKAALDDTVADDEANEGWEVFRPGKDAPQFVQAKGRVTLAGVKAPAIVGGVLLLIAVVLAFTRVQNGAIYAALGVVYLGLMHSITGVGAVVIGTLDAKARFGSFAIAWARMLVAVTLLLVTINLPLTGHARLLLAPMGAGVYAIALYLLFRWTWRNVGIVAAAHFGLAMLLYIGEWLHGAVLGAQMASGTPG
jgi:hypothetical protein